MKRPASATASDRWVRLLLRLYPSDFRDEMGDAFVEAYHDRCRAAAERGRGALAAVWLRALVDSLWNGVGERLRPAVAWRRSGNWGRDMELAARRIRRSPVFALSVIGTLTIGLGAFAVVTAVIDKVLIQPLPYHRPNDLYFVWRDYTAWFDLKRGWVGGPDVAALDTAGGPIAGAVGLRLDQRTLSTNAASAGNPELIPVMISTPKLFDLLGVRPLLGRTFAPSEGGENRAPVIVLGYDLWQRRFGGDRSIVGSDVRLNNTPYKVIGVMDEGFHFVRHSSLGAPERADAFITFAYSLAGQSPRSGAFAALVRARPGASPQQIMAAVAAVGAAIDERTFNHKGLRLYPVGLEADLVAPVRPALVVLGLSALVLIIVLTVNLATLLLTRAAHREREFAVSRALGANRAALVRATLAEAGILGALGGFGAAIIAIWGTRMLVALAPLDLPRRESIAVDWRIGMVVVAVGALLGLCAGVAPAFWATRSTLATLLRQAAVRGGGRGRLRRGLVVMQVALSLVLLSAGGMVARSFEQLLRSHPGFDPEDVLTLRVEVAPWRYPNNASAVAFDDQFQQALAALPGVVATGASSAVPLTANTDQRDVRFPTAPGNTGQSDRDEPLVDVMQSRAGWFRTLRIPILAGRDFAPPRAGAPREAIIDRTLAAQFFPSGGAIGATLVIGDTLHPLTVVGVVDHARQYDLYRDGRPQVYLRDDDDTYGPLYFAVRTTRLPLDLVPDIRAAMRRLDSQLAIADVRTLDDIVNQSVRQQRLSAVLVAGFSLGALSLAAMGLFGVVAGTVAARRHEIAVRLALGADNGSVLRLVLGEGGVLVALGFVVGVPGVLLTGSVIRSALVGVSPFDPLTLSGVVTGMMIVTLAACYLAARRVTAIDPAGAFRGE
ncbi:MAG TPA: ADOP family duplicated permease [Gemmatimonadaceae bacterium]|jgi:putative ABC transport system permease protein